MWIFPIYLVVCVTICPFTPDFSYFIFLTDQSKYSDLNQKDNQTDVQEGLKKQTWRQESSGRRGGQLRSDIINYQQLFIPFINFSDESAGSIGLALLHSINFSSMPSDVLQSVWEHRSWFRRVIFIYLSLFLQKHSFRSTSWEIQDSTALLQLYILLQFNASNSVKHHM